MNIVVKFFKLIGILVVFAFLPMKPLDPKTVDAHAKIEAKMREQAKKRHLRRMEKIHMKKGEAK